MSIQAQQPPAGTIRLEVFGNGALLQDAEVLAAGTGYRTDDKGRVTVSVTAGVVPITVVKAGFTSVTQEVRVEPGAAVDVKVDLQAAFEEAVTVVSSTRTGRRLEDQPTRLEVLDREEIEEKMLMTPGDIVMMLNEMGGMRVQATSPSLGAASVRIQGMRGRYTRVLSDGLPIFGEIGGLGLLQIPPMDLGQVEVIKGVASALYGSGAMGGVVNLLSRRPAETPVREFLVNRSARTATDAVAFLSARGTRGWSASLLAGGHFQALTDIDRDGWADLAGYERGVARPRLFWEGAGGARLTTTFGATVESRDGGTLAGRHLGATGEPYLEALDTRRYDGGVVGEFPAGSVLVSARASWVHQRHEHRFGELIERDRHNTSFAELALRSSGRRHTWVTGIVFERDSYTPRDVSRFAYAFNVPGLFGQVDADVTGHLSLSASTRLDFHSEYGAFLSPRVSALARGGAWTSRLSVGTGFSAATPLTEETEAAGLTRLTVDEPLEAERGLSASFDLSRTDGPLSYTVTLFGSRVTDALSVDRSSSFRLFTQPEPTTNRGVELLGVFRQSPFSVTATYTYVRAREAGEDLRRRDVALTPRHSVGIVGMWEVEDRGRVGVEWYYTGRQRLEANPHRDVSEPYMIVGILAERQFGRLRLFLNGENLTGVRQTTWDPLLKPFRAADGRWTVDAWAPLDGRTINGGVRVRF